jgi:hypothetical protein
MERRLPHSPYPEDASVFFYRCTYIFLPHIQHQIKEKINTHFTYTTSSTCVNIYIIIFRRMFLVKPKCGLIKSDYQIVVFQLLKTNRKESLYAEQWSLIFDGFDNNSVH